MPKYLTQKLWIILTSSFYSPLKYYIAIALSCGGIGRFCGFKILAAAHSLQGHPRHDAFMLWRSIVAAAPPALMPQPLSCCGMLPISHTRTQVHSQVLWITCPFIYAFSHFLAPIYSRFPPGPRASDAEHHFRCCSAFMRHILVAVGHSHRSAFTLWPMPCPRAYLTRCICFRNEFTLWRARMVALSMPVPVFPLVS